MRKLFDRLVNSFDNENAGFSARKLTAFALVLCIYYIHYKYVNESIAIEALIVDLCGVLISLGIITAEQVIKLKNGGNNENNESK
jgi:hypothetical protein